MSNTFTQIVADGVTQNFSFDFTYLLQSHVSVRRNGTLMLVPLDYTFLTASSIRFRFVPALNDLIEIRRNSSPDSALVTFQSGAFLTADDLNTSDRQNFFLVQEVQDQITAYLSESILRFADSGTSGSLTPTQLIESVAQEVLNSELLAELQTRIGDIDTNAQSLIEQTLRVDIIQDFIDEFEGVGFGTFVLDEQQSRITGDSALQAQLDVIGAYGPGQTSFILDLDTVRVGPTETLATRLSLIASESADNAAAIVTEASTRASADTAIASDVTTLSTTVGGHTTSIATNVSSIDGIQAKYTVKIDNNGYLSGYGLISTANNGVPTSEFIVLADKFAIVHPGDSPVVPFIVTGGVTYMQNVVVGSTVRQGQTAYDTGTGFFLGTSGGVPKFSLGDASGNKLTWDGSVLAISGSLNIANTVQTFSPTTTSFSTDPTQDLSYIDLGAVVIMWADAGWTGTSDTTSIFITNVPSAIRPTGALSRIVPCNVVDNGTTKAGTAVVSWNGELAFIINKVSGTHIVPTAGEFTASGTKGLPTGWMIIYPK